MEEKKHSGVHKHHEGESTSEKKEHSREFTAVIRKNPWILSTLVLAAVILVFFIANIFGFVGFSGNAVISEEEAGHKVVNFLNSQTGGGVSYVSSLEKYGLYEVVVSYQNQKIPVYVTQDGNYFIQGVTDMNATAGEKPAEEEPEEVPKSDKPVVQLFLWGYCPYGVQAQSPLAQVVNLLGSSVADFKAVMYYDGHGAYETQQNKIQECIQELYPAKYWSYASKFVSDVYTNCSSTRTEDCDKTQSVKVMKSLGIDSTKVLSCVDTKGEELISASSSLAQELGVTGSPTLVINGVKVTNIARTAEAFKMAICGAFNTPPEKCKETLNSSSATSSGSC